MEKIHLSRRELLGVMGVSGLSALAGEHRPAQAAPAEYRSLVLAKKPAGYWRLGEREGTTARDETPHRHDGAYHGRVAYGQPGAVRRDDDTAVRLDGRDAYVEVPDSDSFSQPASGEGMTVEAWMRPDLLVFDGDTEARYVHWLGTGEQGAFEWGLCFYSRRSPRPNRISAYTWNPGGGLGSGAYFQDQVERGEWIHVVACYDPGSGNDPGRGVSIYRNGVLRGSPKTQKGALYSAYQITPAPGSAPLRFGTRDGNRFFDGALDEVALYPRVLSAAEIREHYRVAAGR